MSAPAYFDTCTLLGWASAALPDCDGGDTAIAEYVDERLADITHTTSVSAITLIEFYDNVALWFRGPRHGADLTWLDQTMAQVHRWLADEALRVMDPAPKLYEHAMRYVRMNTEPDRRKFRAMDASHLVHAVWWARTLGEKVELVSYDTDFSKLLARYAGFGRFISQIDPRTGARVA